MQSGPLGAYVPGRSGPPRKVCHNRVQSSPIDLARHRHSERAGACESSGVAFTTSWDAPSGPSQSSHIGRVRSVATMARDQGAVRSSRGAQTNGERLSLWGRTSTLVAIRGRCSEHSICRGDPEASRLSPGCGRGLGRLDRSSYGTSDDQQACRDRAGRHGPVCRALDGGFSLSRTYGRSDQGPHRCMEGDKSQRRRIVARSL